MEMAAARKLPVVTAAGRKWTSGEQRQSRGVAVRARPGVNSISFSISHHLDRQGSELNFDLLPGQRKYHLGLAPVAGSLGSTYWSLWIVFGPNFAEGPVWCHH